MKQEADGLKQEAEKLRQENEKNVEKLNDERKAIEKIYNCGPAI